jgi:hypothetical protein
MRQEETVKDLQLIPFEVTHTADVQPLIHDAFMWLVEPQYPTVGQLQTAMAIIGTEAQQIVIRAYGLDGGKPLALSAIADEANCSFSLIQKIFSEALAQLAALLSHLVTS